ncbi:hypothetical protein AGOR_G00194510 [Albula goreensis]|uniref:Transmembrane protein family 132 middle domain-containing protein n=1 Tax=Albula goreensis TaxID=1534307 RepID=A0A8T3CRM5_9TELE|nr:hypothetical protein AGOR_G00194510 [Albula goreensis]
MGVTGHPRALMERALMTLCGFLATVPSPWDSLPLSQSDLGLLFSNATPFSCSQSLLVVPPAGARSSPGVQASFGPYSVTQPPLGLCLASLSLPKHWFAAEKKSARSRKDQSHRLHYPPRHRPRHRGRHLWASLASPKSKTSHSADHIQLYYSSSGTVSNLKASPPSCTEDKLQQSQGRLYHIGAVTLQDGAVGKNRSKEEMGCSDGQEEEELRLDPNVLIGYRRGPVRAGRPIGVSVSVRSNFTGDFVIISPTVLYQVACLSLDGLERSFGVAMTVTAHWWVEYSGRNSPLPPQGGVVSTFSFTDREIVGIAPITESNTIINTAILNNQPVSLPVIVLAVGHDGKVSDVTAAVTCRSANEDIVKVSSDCSALFVDGSESGVGSTCVGVEYHLGTLSGALCLSVWAPIVPLLVSLSDPVLNAIDGWTSLTDGGCSPVFQHSVVQVLAQFAAQPSVETGQLTYMLGSPDWFVDVTELVRDWLRVENPQVAALGKRGYLIGLQPGVTSLQVISSQWDGVLGSCDVTVTADHVTLGDLSVQLVAGLSLSVTANPAHPSVVTATATAHNMLYNLGQEAALSIWLQFSDDTATLVSAFNPIPFTLRLSSLAETVVAVTPGPNQRVLAQGDGGGPLLKAELLVSTCQLTSDAANGREGGGTKRLAKGSGWVRVNLDSDFQPEGSEEPGFEVLEISEVFLESGLYGGEDGDKPSNSSDEYGDGDSNDVGVARAEELERAVLTPNHDASSVYFPPSQEEEGMSSGEGEGGRGGGERELEVGVGAVLSLLCLSVLLFLVNCLPCTLRERGRRRRRVTEMRGREDGGASGLEDGQRGLDGEEEEERGEEEEDGEKETGEKAEMGRRRVV